VYVLSVIEISARFVIVIRDVKNVFFVSEIFRDIFKYFLCFLKDLKKVFKQVLGTIQSVRKCICTDNCLKWLCIHQCL